MPGFRYKGTIYKVSTKKEAIFTNGEKAGMALSLALFLFGLADGDIPLCFFTASFLVYEAHIVLKKARGNQEWFLANVLKGMSIAMFVGSIAMVFV